MYLVSLSFALQGGKEQRALRCPPYDPQITVKTHSDSIRYLEYKEDQQTKSNQGGLVTRKWQPKFMKVLGNSDDSCNIMTLYSKYISLLPPDPKCNALYKYELPTSKLMAHTWYQDWPLGVNAVAKVISMLMSHAGFKGRYTNHSLRVTAATRMFNAGMEEQVVKEKTGHKSDAIRVYERTADRVLQDAEQAVIGNKARMKVAKTDQFGVDTMSGSALSNMFNSVGSKTVKSVCFEVQYHNEKDDS